MSLFPTDTGFYIVGILATFLIAFGKGAFGGGMANLGIPIFAFAIAPIEGAIIVAVLVAVMDIFAIRSFGRANISWPDFKVILPGLLLGIALGWWLFAMVDPRVVALIIGLISVSFALHWFLKGRTAPPSHMPPHALGGGMAGLASGFTTFVAHAGGPPVAMYLLKRGLDKSLLAGTTVAVFMLGNYLKLPPYIALGLKTPHVLWAILPLLPVIPLGIVAGKALHDRLEQRQLFFWTYLLLLVAASKMIFDAVRALIVA